MTVKINHICAHCGSGHIKLDAWASWNFDEQKWELESTFENAYCDYCEGECTVTTMEIKSEPDLPKCQQPRLQG